MVRLAPPTPTCSVWLSRSVDVAAVANRLNDDPSPRLVDLVGNPMVTSSGTVESFEVGANGTAVPLRCLGYRSVDELEGNLLR